MFCDSGSIPLTQTDQNQMETGQQNDARKFDTTTTFKLCELVFGDGKRLPMYLPVQGLDNQSVNDPVHPANQNNGGGGGGSLPPFLLKTPDVPFCTPPPPPCFPTQPTNMRPVPLYSQSTESLAPQPVPNWQTTHQMAPQFQMQYRAHGYPHGAITSSCQPTTSGSYVRTTVPTVNPCLNVNQPVQVKSNCYQYANQGVIQQQPRNAHPLNLNYGLQQQMYTRPSTNADPFLNSCSASAPPPPYSVGLSSVVETTNFSSVPHMNGVSRNAEISDTESAFDPTISSSLDPVLDRSRILQPPLLPFPFRPLTSVSPVTHPTTTFSYARKFYQLKPEIRRLNSAARAAYNFTVGNSSYSVLRPSIRNQETVEELATTSNTQTYSKVPVIVWNKGFAEQNTTATPGTIGMDANPTIPFTDPGSSRSTELQVATTTINSNTATTACFSTPVSTTLCIPITKNDVTTDEGLSYTVLTYDPDDVWEKSGKRAKTSKDNRMMDNKQDGNSMELSSRTPILCEKLRAPSILALSTLAPPSIPTVLSALKSVSASHSTGPVQSMLSPTISESQRITPVQPVIVFKVRMPDNVVVPSGKPSEVPCVDSVNSSPSTTINSSVCVPVAVQGEITDRINEVSVSVAIQATVPVAVSEVPQTVPIHTVSSSTISNSTVNVLVPVHGTLISTTNTVPVSVQVPIQTTPPVTVSEVPLIVPIQATHNCALAEVPETVPVLAGMIPTITNNQVSVSAPVLAIPTTTINEIPVSVPIRETPTSTVVESRHVFDPLQSAISRPTISESPDTVRIAAEPSLNVSETKETERYAVETESTSLSKVSLRHTHKFEHLEPPPSALTALCKNLNSKTTDEVLQEMANWASCKSRKTMLAASESLRGGSGLLKSIVKIERMIVEDLSSDREMDPMNLNVIPQDRNVSEYPSSTTRSRDTSSFEQSDENVGSISNSCDTLKEIRVKQEPLSDYNEEIVPVTPIKVEVTDEISNQFPKTPTRDEYDLKLVVKGTIDDNKIDSLFRSCSVVLECLNAPVLKRGTIDLKRVTKRDIFLSGVSKRKAENDFGSKKVCVGNNCYVRSCRIANKLSKLVYFEEGGSCEWRATNIYKKRCVCCQSEDHDESANERTMKKA